MADDDECAYGDLKSSDLVAWGEVKLFIDLNRESK